MGYTRGQGQLNWFRLLLLLQCRRSSVRIDITKSIAVCGMDIKNQSEFNILHKWDSMAAIIISQLTRYNYFYLFF